MSTSSALHGVLSQPISGGNHAYRGLRMTICDICLVFQRKIQFHRYVRLNVSGSGVIINWFKYITIHARRDDFANYCDQINQTTAECFPTMQDYSRGVFGIQVALEKRLGVVPRHVVVVSDERDTAWWDEVRNMGWYTPDHEKERTVEKYGSWCGILLFLI